MEVRTQDGSDRKAPLVPKPTKERGITNEKMGVSHCSYSRKLHFRR